LLGEGEGVFTINVMIDIKVIEVACLSVPILQKIKLSLDAIQLRQTYNKEKYIHQHFDEKIVTPIRC
tara:strand:- start:605 stop:805 length:201 start_codon:yes stop_codon:yes gene_type:complete